MEFPVFVFALPVSMFGYHLIDSFLQYNVQRLAPKFYDNLKQTDKKEPYFAFMMGMIFVLCTTPFLVYQAVVDRDTYTPLTQIMYALRMTVFLAELPRLDRFPIVTLHHYGGAFVMLYAMYTNQTLSLLWIYALLISEVPGDLIYILSAHGYNKTVFYRRLVLGNICQYIVFRMCGSLLVIGLHINQYSSTVGRLVLNIAIGSLYGAYMLTYVVKQIKRYIEIRRFSALSTSVEL